MSCAQNLWRFFQFPEQGECPPSPLCCDLKGQPLMPFWTELTELAQLFTLSSSISFSPAVAGFVSRGVRPEAQEAKSDSIPSW